MAEICKLPGINPEVVKGWRTAQGDPHFDDDDRITMILRSYWFLDLLPHARAELVTKILVINGRRDEARNLRLVAKLVDDTTLSRRQRLELQAEEIAITLDWDLHDLYYTIDGIDDVGLVEWIASHQRNENEAHPKEM